MCFFFGCTTHRSWFLWHGKLEALSPLWRQPTKIVTTDAGPCLTLYIRMYHGTLDLYKDYLIPSLFAFWPQNKPMLSDNDELLIILDNEDPKDHEIEQTLIDIFNFWKQKTDSNALNIRVIYENKPYFNEGYILCCFFFVASTLCVDHMHPKA